MMFKVVLDTNLLVSAFLTPKGEAGHILKRMRNHQLCLSRPILAELARVLQYPRIRQKYVYTERQWKRYLRALLKVSRLISVSIKIDVCSDHDDNEILACAVEAAADYLVTRNVRHFPSEYQSVRVISPTQFMRLLGDNPTEP